MVGVSLERSVYSRRCVSGSIGQIQVKLNSKRITEEDGVVDWVDAEHVKVSVS